jgi:Domain of unknown function (DUF3846)
MATLLKADGTEEEIFPADKKKNKFTLAEQQKLVGGYIQVLRLPKRMRLVMDEEGKMKSKPVNLKATELSQGLGLMPGDFLVGDVIYCTGKESD